MRETSNFEVLREEILKRSDAQTWQAAKKEWNMIYVTREESGTARCLCGHAPIKELCVIENLVNGNTAIVGNVCIHKFLGFRPDLIIDSIDRIAEDDTRTISTDALAFLKVHDVLNPREYEFTEQRMHKNAGKMSESQLNFRRSVNRKILGWFEKRRRELQARKRARIAEREREEGQSTEKA